MRMPAHQALLLQAEEEPQDAAIELFSLRASKGEYPPMCRAILLNWNGAYIHRYFNDVFIFFEANRKRWNECSKGCVNPWRLALAK